MQITINLPQDQIQLLAMKMGYEYQIEDTTQPMVGDTYPMIDNPVTLQQFTEGMINQTLMKMILDRLRSEIRADLENQYNKVVETLTHGGYDDDIMTKLHSDVLTHIKEDLLNGQVLHNAKRPLWLS